MNRGDLFDVDGLPGGPRPVAIATRNAAIPVLSNVTVAIVTTTIRGIRTEVAVGPEHGLTRTSVINCDNLYTLPKSALGRRRGSLGPAELRAFDDALRVALELD